MSCIKFISGLDYNPEFQLLVTASWTPQHTHTGKANPSILYVCDFLWFHFHVGTNIFSPTFEFLGEKSLKQERSLIFILLLGNRGIEVTDEWPPGPHRSTWRRGPVLAPRLSLPTSPTVRLVPSGAPFPC